MFYLIKRKAIWVLWGITAMMMTGCAGMQRDRATPQVTLAHIQVAELKALETAFQIELRVFNPTDRPLHMKAIQCDLELNDKPFATGVSSLDTTIDPFGTDTVQLVVYSSVLDTVSRLIGAIQKVKKNQTVDDMKYAIKGRIHVGGKSASVIRFKSQGVFNLK